MNKQNQVLASAAGVCVAAAAVLGAVLASADGDHAPAPKQQPAGNAQPIDQTVTATDSPSASPTSARPTAVAVAKVSASKKAAAPRRRAVVVQQQGDPVTDPTSDQPAPVTAPKPDSTLIDNGTGTVDESGIHRAPPPAQPIRHAPPVAPPPPAPSPSAS